MLKLRKLSDRDALRKWTSFSKDFSTPITEEKHETFAEKKQRTERLLDDFAAFCYYYFPRVTKAKFANWHKTFTNYMIAADYNINIAVLMISRDMAKSSVTALLVIFLYYKKEFKSLALFSHNYDNAETLLNPIKSAIEKNELLIRDFGYRVGVGSWSAGHFVTNDGVSFKAFGAGQTPRGGKTDDADRYDFLIFDDFDHPDVCLSPDRLDKNWKYVEGDCYPALHVAGKKRIIHLNNKIAEDCIIERVRVKAETDFPNALVMTVNLVDKNGHSNWKEAYSDEECDEMIRLAGDEAETEYMNEPSSKGKEFLKEWMQFKKMPPLNKYKHLVAYLDGGFKKTKTSDTKALVLIGMIDGEYHLRKCYVENVSIGQMIDWHYDLDAWLKMKNATAEWWMEEVFLLSLLHDHFDDASEEKGYRIPMRGDKRKKPDKDLRIGSISGYFERSKFWFDEELKYCRYTKRLISQFLKFKKGVKNNEKDGPDATEGAIFLLNKSVAMVKGMDITTGSSRKNKFKI